MMVRRYESMRALMILCASASLFACDPEPSENPTAPTGEDMSQASAPDMRAGAADMKTTAPETDMPSSVEPDMPVDDPDMKVAPDQLRIAGLSAPVKVDFDERGVPHVSCQTNEDCFAAQGYYHAAHRFVQMDLRRRLGRGRLSSLLTILNQDALDLDIATRQLLTTRDGDPLEDALYETLDDDSRAYIDAYTRGVNAWLTDLEEGRNGAQLSEEYDFAIINSRKIPAWEPQDSIACGLLFLNSLMDGANSEIRAGRAVAAMDEAQFLDFHRGWHLGEGSSVITSAGGTYDALGAPRALTVPGRLPELSALKPRLQRASSALEEASSKLGRIKEILGEGPFGSNAWATAPAFNSTDHAILSNDPHLQLTNPALWYLMTMDSSSTGEGDLHAAGVSFAGVPGIMIGYSDQVAWSATVAYWDMVDVYTEQLSEDGEGVMRDGAKVEFIKKTYSFPTATGEKSYRLLFVPGHGPVVSLDEDAGVAITIKSVLSDTAADVKLFVNMGRTKSMAEAKELLSESVAAGFNFTLIDRLGNISYYPFAGLPRREWDTAQVPVWMPLPGTGEYEWSPELIRAGELPELENPPNHFIATANAAITDDMLDGLPGNDGYPPLQSAFMAVGARQSRAVEALLEREAHDVNSHIAIQGDDRSWYADKILPQLLEQAAALELSSASKEVVDVLSAWDRTCPTGLDGSDPQAAGKASGPAASASIGCAAFHVFVYSLSSKLFDDETAAARVWVPRSNRARILYWLLVDPTVLAAGEVYWDDVLTEDVTEDRAMIVDAALELTAENLERLFGSSDPDEWRWGRIHTLVMGADLLNTVTDDFDNGPFAAPGGLFTLNVASPSAPGDGDGYYGFSHGPSMRMVVEGKPEGFVAHFNFPGGQVHRRDSPFYDNLVEDFLINKTFIMPFTPEEVTASSKQVETFEPAE